MGKAKHRRRRRQQQQQRNRRHRIMFSLQSTGRPSSVAICIAKTFEHRDN